MNVAETHPEFDVAGWDWDAERKAQERSREWLARRTARSVGTVHDYANGRQRAPLEWRRQAAIVLGMIEK